MTYHPIVSANLYPGALDASGIVGYKQLIKPPMTVATEVDLTEDVVDTDGEVLMQAFVSPALGIDEIAAGDWVFRVYGYVDTVDGDSEIVIRVYKRDAAGSETELFDTTTGALTVSAAGYTITESESAFSLSAATDRLVVKFFAKTSSTGTRTVHLFYMGAARQTRLSMPSEITVVPGGDMLSSLYDSDQDGQISGGGSGGHTIQDEGVDLTTRTKINFKGAGVTAADNSGDAATDVTIPGASVDPWISDTNTWSYSSADSPTFVISVNADMTGLIGVGMRIKLTQTTAKYFIVTAVGAYSGGVTLITVYGGTDYTLADEAISSPAYSFAKVPIGFPLTDDKWTVAFTDSVSRNLGSAPTANQWYNFSPLYQSIPLGYWRVSIRVMGQVSTTSVASMGITLSDANNTQSDERFTAWAYGLQNGDRLYNYAFVDNIPLALTVKTTYYINIRTNVGSNLYIRGDGFTTLLKAVCAYL
jgi:hypothetical protein